MKFLVVEDQSDQRERVLEYLNEKYGEGNSFFAPDSLENCFQCVNQEKPDVVLLDGNLHGFVQRGLSYEDIDFLNEIVKRELEVPLVVSISSDNDRKGIMQTHVVKEGLKFKVLESQMFKGTSIIPPMGFDEVITEVGIHLGLDKS